MAMKKHNLWLIFYIVCALLSAICMAQILFVIHLSFVIATDSSKHSSFNEIAGIVGLGVLISASILLISIDFYKRKKLQRSKILIIYYSTHGIMLFTFFLLVYYLRMNGAKSFFDLGWLHFGGQISTIFVFFLPVYLLINQRTQRTQSANK